MFDIESLTNELYKLTQMNTNNSIAQAVDSSSTNLKADTNQIQQQAQSNQLQSQTCSSDDKKTKTFSFGKCKVCKDKATGIHYGIPSCEGCKGFFKRSIEKHEKYVCYFGYKCTITPKQRKRCKYCRWRSCLAAGMSFEGIKMGRIPKIEKEKAKYEESESEEETDENENYNLDNRIERIRMSLKSLLNLNPSLSLFNSLNPYNLIPKTSFSELCIRTSSENNIFTLTLIKDRCYQLFRDNMQDYRWQYERAMKLVEKKYNCDILRFSQTLESVWKGFCKTTSDFTKTLVKTIKALPGFDKFDTYDVGVLVSERLFSVYGLHVTKLFINDESYAMFDSNIQATQYWMERLLGIKTSEKIFNYHNQLNSYRLTEGELAILVPWILCSADIQVSNKELLYELRLYYTQVLIYELNLNQRTPEYFNSLSKTLLISTEINKLCKQVCYEDLK